LWNQGTPALGLAFVLVDSSDVRSRDLMVQSFLRNGGGASDALPDAPILALFNEDALACHGHTDDVLRAYLHAVASHETMARGNSAGGLG
jgi:hypothetical protein